MRLISGEANSLPRTLWQEASTEQAQRQHDNPYEHEIARKLGSLTGSIVLADLQEALGVPMRERRASGRLITAAMRALGWTKKDARTFVKGDPARRIKTVSGALMSDAPNIRGVG
jgi:hypothetical protein